METMTVTEKPESTTTTPSKDPKAIVEERRTNLTKASRAMRKHFGEKRELTDKERTDLIIGKSPQEILRQAEVPDDTIETLLEEATSFIAERNREKQEIGDLHRSKQEEKLSPEAIQEALKRSQQEGYQPKDNPEAPPQYRGIHRLKSLFASGKHRAMKPFGARGKHRAK